MLVLFTAPAYSASAKVEKCIKGRNCEFFIFGALTPKPTMSINVVNTSWDAFSNSEREEVIAMLREHIRAARLQPAKYAEEFAHIRANAPVFDKVQKSLSQLKAFSVLKASQRHPERGSWLTGDTILEGSI